MNFWAKLDARRRLIKAFKAGEIYLTFDENRYIFPKIRNVSVTDDITQISFTLPTGIDPKKLEKQFYVFEQCFGKRVSLDGEIKRFTLTVNHKTKSDEVPYNFEELHAIIKTKELQFPIVAGQDSQGKMHIYDATKNPNLLIYGEPGSGKSSILHIIHTTLIQLFTAEDLQFYMADFKQAELPVYEGVKHVKSVSYTPKELALTLKHLKKELEKRGALLRENRVRHINKLPKDKKPPYIVLTVDEFVMIRDEDIVADLLQIASLGRAYGIYLILSMQRPSHKILSTDVRGVLSVRMGFRTVDRRNAMIGETLGSEKISSKDPGRFLLNLDDLTELKAPFIDEAMTEKILEPYKMDDWKNHNYKWCDVAPNEDPGVPTLNKPLTEKDVFNDVN